MSAPPVTLRLDSVAAIRSLVASWVDNLPEVLEFLTGERPRLQWQALTAPPPETAAPDADVLWSKQGFSVSPEVAVWVGAPRTTWEAAAALMIKAAGLETPAEGEAQKNWEEMLSQWMSGLARAFGSALGREVLCTQREQLPPPPDRLDWAALTLGFENSPLPPLAIAFSAALLDLLTVAATRPPEPDVSPEPEPQAPISRTMDLLLDVELPVSISFGKTELPLKEVLKLTTGSIVELNRGVDEPVEILVNHCLVARGQVVVVDGNYGVRIQQIIDRQERLRRIR